MSTSEPPAWPHCAQGADPATDPVGCRGIHVPGHTACLAHLTDTERDAYLTGLTPGDSTDHRATTFTELLLLALLNALRDPATEIVRLGNALSPKASPNAISEPNLRREQPTRLSRTDARLWRPPASAVLKDTGGARRHRLRSARWASMVAFRSAMNCSNRSRSWGG